MRKSLPIACAALAASALVPVAMTQAHSAARKPGVVKVRDNYFAPDRLTVPKDTEIVWRWPSLPGDLHDVYLARRPKGVKRFHSLPISSDYSFARKLRKPGRYRIICTFHEEMKMTVKVKRG